MLSKISIIQDVENNNTLGTATESLLEASVKALPESIDIAAWIRFVKELGIAKLFAKLPDGRQLSKTKYPFSSLALWAFSAHAFRLGSKNALQTSLEDLSSQQRQGMLNLLNLKEDTLPHSSTVDAALAKIPLEELSQIPLQLLEQLQGRKFFYNHAHLLPSNALQIGVDGFWLHTYDRPHATDDNGQNVCPYCLPRTRFAGTEKENTYYVHVLVTFVLICPGLTLPLLAYPLKVGQVDLQQPDKEFKEECELKAVHAVLPMIRRRFPRTDILFLGDALYANRPMLRLLKELNIDCLIVFKDYPLRKLDQKCEELSLIELYQKHHTCRAKEVCDHKTVHRQAAWFNKVDAGEGVMTNVLRYCEVTFNKDGTQFSEYKGAWICSKRITPGNCFSTAQTARMRWEHEDLHNTLKNRGFNIKHDMARANPQLLFAWKMMSMIAYFVFELFLCTTAAQLARRTRSAMKFAKDMLQQLINISWDVISQSPCLSKPRVQFRYRFNVP